MRAFVIMCVLLFTVGCSNQKTKPEVPSAPMSTPAVSSEVQTEMKDAPSAETKPTSRDEISANPLTDPQNILSKRSVYFNFDDYSIKNFYHSLIEAHGRYLASHPDAKVTLEGHADERGTREYNLALGQKRAASVKQMMNLYGASDRQIETVSYGEEKPLPNATGHDENAWSLNRRVDIRYMGE